MRAICRRTGIRSFSIPATYAGLLTSALDAFGWDAVQARVRERRANGELVGVGICYFLEKSGQGPSDSALVSVDRGGFVEVVTGGASVGQGFETVMAQICAETLGVDYRAFASCTGRPTGSALASARMPRVPR